MTIKLSTPSNIYKTQTATNWKSMNQFLMLWKVYFSVIAIDCKTNSALVDGK